MLVDRGNESPGDSGGATGRAVAEGEAAAGSTGASGLDARERGAQPQRSHGVQPRQPRKQKRGGACPIGAPSRREGGWNPRGSVRIER